jgi:hypothetical protein
VVLSPHGTRATQDNTTAVLAVSSRITLARARCNVALSSAIAGHTCQDRTRNILGRFYLRLDDVLDIEARRCNGLITLEHDFNGLVGAV